MTRLCQLLCALVVVVVMAEQTLGQEYVGRGEARRSVVLPQSGYEGRIRSPVGVVRPVRPIRPVFTQPVHAYCPRGYTQAPSPYDTCRSGYCSAQGYNCYSGACCAYFQRAGRRIARRRLFD